jgi:hypothetical protein
MKNELCQRFIRDSLVNSFTKVLCDEAVQTWKHEIFVGYQTSINMFDMSLCLDLLFLEIYLSELYDIH